MYKNFLLGLILGIFCSSWWSYINNGIKLKYTQSIHTDYCNDISRVPTDIEYLWIAYNNPNSIIQDSDGSRDKFQPKSFYDVLDRWISYQISKNKYIINNDEFYSMPEYIVEIERGINDPSIDNNPLLTFVVISGWSNQYIDKCLNIRDLAGD